MIEGVHAEPGAAGGPGKEVDQPSGGHHTHHAADHNFVAGNARCNQEQGAHQAEKRRGRADAPRIAADDQVLDRIAGRGQYALGLLASVCQGQGCQRGSPADGIGRTGTGRPDTVSGHIGRIGKKYKRAPGKGRIQKVAPHAAENLFTDDNPEGKSNGHLPERQGGGQGQGKQQSGYQQPFTDMVSTNGGKQCFPEKPHRVNHQDHRYKNPETPDKNLDP